MLVPADVVRCIPGTDSPRTKTFTYKKTKQADLAIVVHYPLDWKESDTRPVIVFFFGGGWTEGSIHQFEPQASYLASRGMVAARADYRVKFGMASPPRIASRTRRVPFDGCGRTPSTSVSIPTGSWPLVDQRAATSRPALP